MHSYVQDQSDLWNMQIRVREDHTKVDSLELGLECAESQQLRSKDSVEVRGFVGLHRGTDTARLVSSKRAAQSIHLT